MAKSNRYIGWTKTHPDNFPYIDFYNKIGGVFRVVHIKTTEINTYISWISNNRKHLESLRDLTEFGKDRIQSNWKELHIYVPKNLYDEGHYASWANQLKTQYDLKDVIISTIEKEFLL